MSSRKPTAIALTVISLLIVSVSSATAHRPLVPIPNDCKKFIHGNVGKAKKKSKAKRRARSKWQTRALGQAGYGMRKWGWSQHKHYDCSKKGKWHHCTAAAFPCPRFTDNK